METPIHPGEEIGNGFRAGEVAQAFAQVEAEVVDLHSHGMSGWRQMGSDLNIRHPEVPTPFREQFAGQMAVDAAQPIRGNGDVLRLGVEQFVQATNDVHRQAFGDLRVGQ